MNQAAKTAPAVARNREPILRVLRNILPPSALVLEIASGTGEHAVWFSRALPAITWQPTDQDPEALKSITAWRDMTGLPNLLPPDPGRSLPCYCRQRTAEPHRMLACAAHNSHTSADGE